MRFKDFLLLDEGKFDKVIRHLGNSGMPKGKVKHSQRVALTVKDAQAGKDAQMAAAFHDYLERGGDIETAKKKFKLSDLATNVIQHLSDPDKTDSDLQPNNGPLAHMQAILGDARISLEEKKIVVLIKIADRIDNLMRRGNKVSRGYSAKSQELLSFLFNFYYSNFGKDQSIKSLLAKQRSLTQPKKRQVRVPSWKQWKRERANADLDQDVV